jgi:hypothetical protein
MRKLIMLFLVFISFGLLIGKTLHSEVKKKT